MTKPFQVFRTTLFVNSITHYPLKLAKSWNCTIQEEVKYMRVGASEDGCWGGGGGGGGGRKGLDGGMTVVVVALMESRETDCYWVKNKRRGCWGGGGGGGESLLRGETMAINRRERATIITTKEGRQWLSIGGREPSSSPLKRGDNGYQQEAESHHHHH